MQKAVRFTRTVECVTCGLGFYDEAPLECASHELRLMVHFIDCMCCQSELSLAEEAAEPIVELGLAGVTTSGRFCAQCQVLRQNLDRTRRELTSWQSLPPAQLGMIVKPMLRRWLDLMTDEELGQLAVAAVSGDAITIGRLTTSINEKLHRLSS